jgi:molybdopterin converting factor small subunit
VPTVKIPPVLRAHVGGEATVEAPGSTVGEVLESLTSGHEGLQSQLFDEAGQLNRFVNIYLNDEDVRLLDGLDTAASESDTVVILPAMAGGR